MVSRGGRPDLAGEALPKVQAPTLLIVGGNDDIVIELNEQARDKNALRVKLEAFPVRCTSLKSQARWRKWLSQQAIGS